MDWIKERQSWLRAQLNWPKRFPTNSTYTEALARCDAEQLVTVIASVLLKARAVEQCGTEPSRVEAHQQEETPTHVAMDGKPYGAHAVTRARDSPRCTCSPSMRVTVASS